MSRLGGNRVGIRAVGRNDSGELVAGERLGHLGDDLAEEFAAAVDGEGLVNVLDVVVNGVAAQLKCACDRFFVEAVHEEVKNFALARGRQVPAWAGEARGKGRMDLRCDGVGHRELLARGNMGSVE